MKSLTLNQESEVELTRRFLPPPIVQFSTSPNFDMNSAQAEATFKMLFDNTTKDLTNYGYLMCKEMKITAE
jgi:hypothetical protein